MERREDPANKSLLTTRIQERGLSWGRESQSKQLRELAIKVAEQQGEESRCHVALLHGPAGCGKTFLCEKVKSDFPTYRYLFGKFDHHRDNTSPFATLACAFDGLIANVGGERGSVEQPVIEGADSDFELSEKIRSALGSDAALLRHLVPSFSKLFAGGGVPPEEEEESDASVNRKSNKMVRCWERLAVALVAVLRTACAPAHPVILVLSDLQWADAESLSVLNEIVSAEELPNLLFIGTFRDDEDQCHALDTFLQSVNQRPPVHSILTGNLNRDEASSMLMEILSLEPDTAGEQALALVELVYRKTLGNPYFMLQFLEMLQRDQLLVFNFATLQWQWDIDAVQKATSVADNVAAIITSRLGDLSSSLLRLLQYAACLGFSVNVELLEKLVTESTDVTPSLNDTALEFSEMMEQTVKQNLLERTGDKSYRFSHNKVQESIYALIQPACERDKLHWQIGKFIQKAGAGDARMRFKFLFLAVDQLNRGSSCISTESERLDLIRLNYEACLKAKQRNGVDLVGLFLNHALGLIQERDWDTSYSLLIDIHSLMSEFEASRGLWDAGISYAERIVEKAKSPEDTASALASIAHIRMSQSDFHAAIKAARNALALCGERLPSANKINVILELVRTKRMVQGKTDEELLHFPPMTDPRKRIAMKVFLTCLVCGWNVDPNLFALGCIRMFRTTLRFGQNPTMGSAFAAFGTVLASTGEENMGYRFARLGLRLQDGQDGCEPDFVVVSYPSVFHIKQPIASLVDPCLTAYRRGLETGNTFYGSLCLMLYAHAYMDSGLRLGSFALDLRRFAGQLKVLHLDGYLGFLLPSLQLALNLSGQSQDPVRITWDILLELGDIRACMNPWDAPKVALMVNYYQLFNAYVLRDADIAAAALKRILAVRERQFAGNVFNNYFFAISGGLVGFWLGAEQRNTKFFRFAQQSLKWLKGRANINTAPLVLWLEAQHASTSTTKDVASVKSQFDNVTVMLARSGLVHYGAIANEQIGEFLLKRTDAVLQYEAKTYFERAVALYQEWGAKVKCQQLAKSQRLESFAKDSSFKTGSALRGRERFTSVLDHARSGTTLDGKPRTTLELDSQEYRLPTEEQASG